MKAPRKVSAQSPPSGEKTRGLKQSFRVFLFALAAAAFVLFTYLAFFRANFPAPGSSRGNVFTASWWLRPIEFNVSGRVNHIDPGVDFTCISALADGSEMWIGGRKGVILHSQDSGRTWKQLPTVNVSAEASSPAPTTSPPPQKKASLDTPAESWRQAAADSEQDEWIQVTESKKSSKAPNYAPTPEGPTQSVAPQPSPYETKPSPTVAPSPTIAPSPRVLRSNDIVDLSWVNSSVGYALTQLGELLATRDGGQSWRLLTPSNAVRIRFRDEKHGVVAGDYGLSWTEDADARWITTEFEPIKDVVFKGRSIYTVGSFDGVAVFFAEGDSELIRLVPSLDMKGLTRIEGLRAGIRPQLDRIAVAPSGSLFACGKGGLVVRFLFREVVDSRALDTRQSANFNGIFFASDNIGWAVGDRVIIATRDAGEHWENQTPASDSDLKAVHFLDQSRGFAAGTNGTVIGTNNGGRSWDTIVTSASPATAGRGHGWLPAPWYFASLVLLFGLVRMIPEEARPPPREGIGQLLVSDEPIETAERDFLGFKQVALGLSNYLRNNATNPPLTIAITGEWGMGKSSLMNLLNGDLRRYKFKPVWFNAWHHQTEESLLAALLENVRTQAIPSTFTPEGIVFRAKLLWARARKNLVAFMVIVGVATFSLSYFAADPHRLTEPPEALLNFLLHPGEALSRLKLRDMEVGKTMVVLAATLGALLTFLKGFRAFGVDPASLLASKSNAAKAKDLRAQTSFRYSFANEFREVSASLNPLTMVLFVDDLDRCRPEQVYDMLEAINFLVSCGDCFVVMGFARRRVERCVGLVFEKVAAERPDAEGETPLSALQKRERFARMYLEKLINIEVPVPPGQPDQIRSLLINKPSEVVAPRKMDILGEKISNLRPHLLPIVGAIVAAMIAIWCGGQLFPVSTPPPSQAKSSPTPSPSPAPAAAAVTPASQPSASAAPSVTPGPSPTLTPAKGEIGSAKFISGQTGSAPLWAILLVTAAILTPGIIRLSRRTGSVIEDSPEFINALERWFPFLAARAEMTPRAIKRFVNRLRYFAMMEGSFRPAPRWWERVTRFLERAEKPATEEQPSTARGTREDLLVALATIHERHPDWFEGDSQSLRQKFEKTLESFEIEGKENLDLDMMENEYEHFKKLVAGVEVR